MKIPDRSSSFCVYRRRHHPANLSVNFSVVNLRSPGAGLSACVDGASDADDHRTGDFGG